jgi:hypothetical protein
VVLLVPILGAALADRRAALLLQALQLVVSMGCHHLPLLRVVDQVAVAVAVVAQQQVVVKYHQQVLRQQMVVRVIVGYVIPVMAMAMVATDVLYVNHSII